MATQTHSERFSQFLGVFLLALLVTGCSFDSSGVAVQAVDEDEQADVDEQTDVDDEEQSGDDNLNCVADGICNESCTVDMDCVICGNGICEVGESCDGRRDTEECRSDCPRIGRFFPPVMLGQRRLRRTSLRR